VIENEVKKQVGYRNAYEVEGKPTKFGTSCHVILPKEWLKKVVVTVTKETWEELHDTK